MSDEQPPSGNTRQLHRAYQSKNVEELAEYYDEWAASYEDSMRNVGYMHPAMVSSMVGRHVAIGAGTVLDAGCGTGIIGEILSALGQADLTGIDASRKMLDLAAERGRYNRLEHMFLGRPLDFPNDRFEAVVSAGVFTDGHAPLDGFDELVRVTRPGGRLVFSVARSYLEGPFDEKNASLESSGAWKLIDSTGIYNSAPIGDRLLSRVYVCEVC
jgi:predicted TPR repeat methyltransferase